MKQVRAFQCEGCGELIRSKASATAHNKHCEAVPENRACFTCANRTKPGFDRFFRMHCKLDLIEIGRQYMMHCPSWQAKEEK